MIRLRYKLCYLFLFVIAILISKIGLGQDAVSYYWENFEEAVNLEMWDPNRVEHSDGVPAFEVNQNNGVLDIMVNQVHYYDSWLFDFKRFEYLIFNIIDDAHISFDVKIEQGATYAGDEVDDVLFSLSVLGPNEEGVLEPQVENFMMDAPVDGHTLTYDL